MKRESIVRKIEIARQVLWKKDDFESNTWNKRVPGRNQEARERYFDFGKKKIQQWAENIKKNTKDHNTNDELQVL